jgi:hypothetical protein
VSIHEEQLVDRWACADSILRGRPSPQARRLLRQRNVRLALKLAAAVALVTAVNVGPALLGYDLINDTEIRVTRQRALLGLVVTCCAVPLTFGALVLHIRHQTRRRGHGAPETVLTRAQRRSLDHQLRGQSPVRPELMPLLTDLAIRESGAAVTVSFLGLVLLFIGQALSGPIGLLVLEQLLLVLLLAARLLQVSRRALFARAFLRSLGGVQPTLSMRRS